MTSRFRLGGDRNARQVAGAMDPRNTPTVCPSCGLRNDASAKFCRNCGLPLGWPEDPVRGTTTRRADLPSDHGAGVASIIGLLAAVGLLAVAGFLVLRGSSGGGTAVASHSPSPRASVAASPSGSASSSTGTASNNPSGGPSGSPGSTDTASIPVTPPPGSFPPSTDFTCDPATIGDPTQGRWKVRHVTWQPSAASDSVLMDLTRDGDAGRSGSITAESVTLGEVSSRFGLSAPQAGDRAIVITFDRRFTAFTASPLLTGMKTVPALSMGQGSDGFWHTVLGVAGTGCHRLGVASWTANPAAADAQLVIDVKK